MRKIYLFIVGLLLIFGLSSNVKALEPECRKEAAMNIAKIVYHEAAKDDNAYNSKEEAFYAQIMTAAVILNNARLNSGSTWTEKIYNVNGYLLPYPCFGGTQDFHSNDNDRNYCGDAIDYRNMDFNSYVPYDKSGKLLYIAELVLTEKFNLPRNVYLQAAKSIVISNGKVFDYVPTSALDIYFGYTAQSPDTSGKLANVNAFNHSLSNTEKSYYRNLAKSYQDVDYSKYTSDTVCGGLSNNAVNSSSNNNDVYMDIPVCENPEVLRVIYFASIIVDIVKIIIPIGLVVMAMIDFSKGVTSNSDSDNKKNLSRLIKRFVYAVLIFVVPWIVKIIIINLGNLTKDVNYTDCLENANEEKIKELQPIYDAWLKEQESNNITDNGDYSHEIINASGFSEAAIENLATFAGSEMGDDDDKYWTGLLFQCAVFMNNYDYQKNLSGVDINTPITTSSMCEVFKVKFSGGYYLYKPDYCNYTFTDLAESRNGGKPYSEHYKNLMLKAAEAVLTREFTIPKNIVSARGKDNNANDPGVFYDASVVGADQKFSIYNSNNEKYFEDTDVYGNKVSTDPSWYIKRANELYKKYFG